MKKILLTSFILTVMLILLLSCFKGGGINFNSFVSNSGGNGGGSGGSGNLLQSFPKVFYTTNNQSEYFNSVFPTSDGGILLSGAYYASNDALFVKISSTGQTLWKKLGSIGYQAYSFIQMDDGYYYGSGVAIVNGNPKSFISKLDQNGNTVNILYFEPASVTILPLDSGKIIMSVNHTLVKVSLTTNLDSSNSIKWHYQFNVNNGFFQFGSNVLPFKDNNINYVFIADFVGSTIGRVDATSDTPDTGTFAIFKDIYNLPSSSYDFECLSPAVSNDSADILGVLQNYNDKTIAIIKMDKNLTTVGGKLFSSNSLFDIKLIPTPDGKYLLTLSSGHNSLVVLLDSNLTIISKKIIKMGVRSVIPVSGGFIFAGFLGGYPYDAVVMSLDSLLNPPTCPTIVDTNDIYNFHFSQNLNNLSFSSNLNYTVNSNIITNLQNANTSTTDANLVEDTTCRTSW